MAKNGMEPCDCVEVAEDGQALGFVSEELLGERESLSPRSSPETGKRGKERHGAV